MSEQQTASAPTAHRPWVKIVAVVLAAVLVLGAGALALTLLTGEPERSISLPDSAGGLARDAAVEQQSSQELDAAATRFASIYDGRARAQLGIYRQDDQSRGPVGSINVAGVEIDGETDPQAMIDQVSRAVEGNGLAVDDVDGGQDARAVCASQDSGTSLCFWATTTSFGQVFTTTEGWSVAQLSKLMVAVRGDVESTG